MKTIPLLLALVLPATLLATGQQVRFALTMHCETSGGGGTTGIPFTPNFMGLSTTTVTYVQWREALINFAKQCHARGLPWQYQSDYNFLEGVRRFEVNGGITGTQIMNGTWSDASLSAYTFGGVTTSTNTGGKNVLKYLHEDLGVNLDPHSHESNPSYNYADVAWLIDVGCDTDATQVVGGHVYVTTSSKYQNWPKFIGGLTAATHTVSGSPYVWTPHLMMGGGGDTHRDDPHCTGLWKPLDANNYFTDGGSLAVIGHWEQDFFEIDRLLRSLEDNSLPHNNKLWTCGRVVNHRDLMTTGYLAIKVPAILNTIQEWRDAGRFQVKTFEDIYSEWTTTYVSASSLYLRPMDNISFSLNWQEFCYTGQSNNELRTLLNHHESQRVPVDVFLTTWQTDILESQAPELLGRLLSSRWVNVAYHIRAPKPYAYDSTKTIVWRSYTSADVATYESSQLDMVTGQPVSGVSGGFAKLTSLYGSTPRLVGPNASDSNARSTVLPYFYTAGVRLIVQHDSNNAVNFGTMWNSGTQSMNVRPESYDWRLIETFDTSKATQPISNTLDDAITNAHNASGAQSPYFVGVKLHDNDLIATESAWNKIYMLGKRTPNWDPYTQYNPDNSLRWATPLSAGEPDRRRAIYTGIVTSAAARRTTLNLMDGRDMLSMLGEEAARPIGLSATEVVEGSPVGSTIAEITGGGAESGLRCTYALVSGTGSDDNAAFTVSGSSLLNAVVLSSSQPVRHLRLRWTDGGGNTEERALTIVVARADDDGDGFSETDEIAAGTNPRDSSSRLAVSSSGLSGNSMTINWSSVIGKTYHIDWSSDLSAWTTVPGTQITATSTTTSETVSNATGAQMFFRVVSE
ncbi:MAG: hypothetical protein JNM99_01045 [Verrucomicrobiaceae bacterium]|nr:hypothetical protein [Verrucomicrobiaceae bacterium]